MAREKAKIKPAEQLDLTPMIDVVFQLLIFFMVTAVFAITPGLDIKPVSYTHLTLPTNREV